MSKPDKPGSPLAAAAAALEDELLAFESLAATLKKMPLGSKKHLERAARTLHEAAGFEERIALRLRGLVEAINAASQRQQASAAAIVARAQELEARNAEYGELFGRYAALGAEAQEITALAQDIVGPIREATSPEQIEPFGARLDELIVKMTALGDRAQDVARTAAAKEMTELARDADALKQQLAAARNKLLLLRPGRKAPDQSN
jgi:chromosome segregation ATPase